MSSDKTPPPAKATDFGGLYLPGDRIPTPDAVEANTDSAWALFNELTTGKQEPPGAATAPAALTATGSLAARVANGDQRYAATEPAGLLMQQIVRAHAAAKAPALTPESVMLEARRNNRVCPLPLQWKALYELLPSRTVNGRREPTPPINTAAAWRATPSLSKRAYLREHVEFAAANGCLEPVHAFLAGMQEDEWYHMGE